MKISRFIAITFSLVATSLAAAPMQASNATASVPPPSVKQGLTYAELFDIEENFVDAAVAVMLATDDSMIEELIDIRSVRVSSDGQFAMVGWVYNREYGGSTLMEDQGPEILILIEDEGAISQERAIALGIPAWAAAEIAPN
ncbi:MAG: hypothetical protein AAFP03_04170 [Cyanobacteria bacterium J06598_3]